MIIYGSPDNDVDLFAYGIDTVITGNTKLVPELKAKGYRVYLACGAYGVKKDDTAHQARDINGDPQLWFNSGCPNNEDIIKTSLERVDKLCETPDVEGLIIDGARFSSPCSGSRLSYFTCFCDTCRKKAESMGYDFEKMHRGAKSLYENADVDWDAVRHWLSFRESCVTEYLTEFSRIVRSHGIKSGAFIFSPSIAPMVGQSYDALPKILDIISPMVYRAYKQNDGPACLNHELAAAAAECKFTDEPVRYLSEKLGIDLSMCKTSEDILSGLPVSTAVDECVKAKALCGDTTMIPIIDLNDEHVRECAEKIYEKGIDEVALFVYNKEYMKYLRS